jgi:hypothetical protein
MLVGQALVLAQGQEMGLDLQDQQALQGRTGPLQELLQNPYA